MTRVLYMEDDKNSRDVFEIITRRIMKLEDVTILNETDDIRPFLEDMPDIIFLDIHMKPLDGFDILKIIRERYPKDTYPDLPVIALTASVMGSDVDELKEAGFDGLIGKPISQREFPTIFNQILAGEKTWHVTL